MSIGISLLLHQDFGRAADLTRALLREGCKIAVHIDSKAPLTDVQPYIAEFESNPRLVLTRRIKCEWGTFSLVKAQLILAEALLEKFPKVSHVVQLSGSCLPTRPISELKQFLAENHGTDFIESVLAGQSNWIKGGLEAERFSLYFPFSWKRQRRLFDASVSVQRKLGVARKLPRGLASHIGSQWWVMCRATLSAILNDPKRKQYDRYFSKCWIPDESYFQTLARKHAKRIESRSLTFSRFDQQGNPMLFYNDHLEYLEHLSGFFVRKVWNGANRLYDELLSPDFTAGARDPEMRAVFNAQTERLEGRRNRGRVGLKMQSKAINKHNGVPETAAPYAVLVGFDKIYQGIDAWLSKEIDQPVQGNLFDLKPKNVADNAILSKGNLSGNRHIRDYAPIDYLANLLWNNRDSRLIFQFWSVKKDRVFAHMAQDKNANIHYVRGAWILDLMHENITNENVLRDRVSEMLALDAARVAALQSGRATYQIHSLDAVLTKPAKILYNLIEELSPSETPKPRVLPELLDWQGLENFTNLLKNSGMNIDIELAQTSRPEWLDDKNKHILIAE